MRLYHFIKRIGGLSLSFSSTADNSKLEKQDQVKTMPIMVSLIVGAFLAILNETLLNVAYTDLIAELGVSAATIQWLSTGFLLVVGI